MKVKMFGYDMITDEKNQLQLGKSPYEPGLTHYLNTVLEPGSVFVDVGAMIGYYTLLASKIVGWKGQVYAFEPSPDHFAILDKNVRNNRRKRNVTLVEAAVMDFSAKNGPLHLNTKNVGDHRTVYEAPNEELEREIVMVEYVSLDDFFKVYEPRVDFIKLDIQGAEPYAVMGAERVLNSNHDLVLITEFWPEGIRQAGWEPDDYLATLVDMGFGLHTVTGDYLEPEEVMDNIPGGWTGFMDILCVRA